MKHGNNISSLFLVNRGVKQGSVLSPSLFLIVMNNISSLFLVNRGVKQGSVLSPSLFLIVMNSLLQRMRNLNCGGSIHGTFIGTAVHADDARSIAPNIQSVASQFSEINDFVTSASLKLNPSKLKLIRISQSL